MPVSKIGDGVETRLVVENGRTVREPVLNEAHRILMTRDLYRAGWSYRLIAQFCGSTNEEVTAILMS